MKKTRLINRYRCTLLSDKGMRLLDVVAPSFGKAAKVCIDSISSWEDSDSYELINICYCDICFIQES